MTDETRAGLALGIRRALALPAWIVAFSFLGVGSLAREAGFPLGAAIFSTLVVWAGPAQLILFGSLAHDGLVAAAAIAVGLSAIRLLPMTLAILPYLRRSGDGLGREAVVAHLIAATTWMDAMRNLRGLPPGLRQPYFVAFGATCLALSTVATIVGFLLVGAVPPALAAGLLCLTPIYFTISLVAGARDMADWVAVLLGLALAPVAAFLVGTDFDLLVTGLVGGTAAFLVHQRGARRAAAP